MDAELAFEVERWLEKARDDLGVAQHLDEVYRPKPVEIICFHCQQAGEKAIKAVILARGAQEIPRSHDLSLLLHLLDGNIEKQLLAYADSLTRYTVDVCYPNDLHLEDRDCRTALCAAQQILRWCEAQINLEKDSTQ